MLKEITLQIKKDFMGIVDGCTDYLTKSDQTNSKS